MSLISWKTEQIEYVLHKFYVDSIFRFAWSAMVKP